MPESVCFSVIFGKAPGRSFSPSSNSSWCICFTYPCGSRRKPSADKRNEGDACLLDPWVFGHESSGPGTSHRSEQVRAVYGVPRQGGPSCSVPSGLSEEPSENTASH